MEISRMLTVSTAHIRETTAEWLESDDSSIIVYQKGDYGWFIWLSDYQEYYTRGIPTELFELMKLAKIHDCNWLCLDCDGEVLENLEVFDW